MAETNFASLSAAQKKMWAVETWNQGRDESFWFSMGFVSKGTNDSTKPIHLVTELTETERGSECVMQLVNDLDGDGVAGDTVLEGNEEALVNSAQIIKTDQLRHGVKNIGEMQEQRTVIRFRSTSKDKLAFWLSERLDELMFLTASGVAFSQTYDGRARSSSTFANLAFAGDVAAPSGNRKKFVGAGSSTSALTASDTMTWDTIVEAGALAKYKRLKPIRENGRSYYCAVLSNQQARDLKKSSDYQNLNKDANVRGSKNPLFTGALAVIDGIILHEHNKVYHTIGAASGSKWGSSGTVDGAQALLLGAQAIGFARIGTPFWRESDNTDYGNKVGVSYGRKIGMLKPQYPSRFDGLANEDFGVVSVYSAAAAT